MTPMDRAPGPSNPSANGQPTSGPGADPGRAGAGGRGLIRGLFADAVAGARVVGDRVITVYRRGSRVPASTTPSRSPAPAHDGILLIGPPFVVGARPAHRRTGRYPLQGQAAAEPMFTC